MQHTKKMVVVPQDLIENLRFNQHQRTGSVGRQLMTVDRELKEILARDDLPIDEKMELYYEVLQKYRKLETKYSEKPPATTAPATTAAALPVKERVADEWLDRIDKQFTLRHREKAEQLYEWVKKNSDITWNEKGEIEGQPKSNILTLIDDVTRLVPRYKGVDPNGMADFANSLQASNIPRYMIGNATHYKTYFQQEQQEPGTSAAAVPRDTVQYPWRTTKDATAPVRIRRSVTSTLPIRSSCYLTTGMDYLERIYYDLQHPAGFSNAEVLYRTVMLRTKDTHVLQSRNG